MRRLTHESARRLTRLLFAFFLLRDGRRRMRRGIFGHPVMDNKIYSMFLATNSNTIRHPSNSLRFNGQA